MSAGVDLGSLFTRIVVDANDANRQLRNYEDSAGGAEQHTDSLKDSLKKLAVGLGIGVAVKKVGDALVDCTKSAIDFETSFAQVSTLLDKNTTDYGQYKDSIIKASNETGVAVDELAKSVYGSISAGVDSAKAVQFTTDAVKLAKGGFTDTAKAVDVMTTAINGYKLSADDAGKISDLLITTQNLGKTTVDELASSMGAVIPIASGANFSIEELSASYAQLTKNGIATSEAGTYMKSMLSELTKAGSTTDKALHSLTGKGFADLKKEGKSTTEILKLLSDNAEQNGMTLKDMFSSTEAGSAALVLMSQDGAEYNDILKAMQESSGAAEDAFNKMSETPQVQLNNLKNMLANMGIELGEKLLPIVMQAANYIKQHMPEIESTITNVFDNIGKAIQFVIDHINVILPLISGTVAAFTAFKIISTVAPLFTSLAGAIKGATTAQGALNAVMTANPFGMIALAIGVLVAAGVALYMNWDKVKAAAQELFKELSKCWEDIKTSVKNVLDGIILFINTFVELFTAIWNKYGEDITTCISAAWELIKQVFNTAFTLIINLLNTFKKLFEGAWTGLWETVKTLVVNLWNNISNLLNKWLDLLIQNIKTRVNMFTEAGKAIFTGLWNGLKGVWSSIISWVSNILSNLISSVKGVGSKMYSAGKEIITKLWDGLKDVWGDIKSWVSNKVSWIADKV
ncbi:MAG: phage tail tape measure protein, partial [Clostridia bacterium]|nr:phage tail tape measure protein [Clostridia bacterium]